MPAKDVSLVKTKGLTHLDNPRVYIATEKHILLMIKATDSFI